MLHILLMILKILLWIILGILGLLLLLVLLVLFAPIRYSADAEFHGSAKVYARVKFLILSVRIRFNQEDKSLEQDIRLVGIRLRTDKPAREKKRRKPEKKKDVQSIALDTINDAEDTPDAASDDTLDAVLDAASDGILDDPSDDTLNAVSDDASDDTLDDSFVHEEFDLWDNDDEELPEKERNVFGRIRAFCAGAWRKLKSIAGFLQNLSPDKLADKIDRSTKKLSHKIERLRKFWNMSCTVKTRAYLKRYIVGLIKHISPRRVKGYIRYGFDEPYKTGQITGYLSLMPFVYQKGFYPEPDFYNKVLDGNISIKGKIRIGYIIRIALNVNLWRTVKLASRIMK